MTNYHLSCSWETVEGIVIMRPMGYLNDQTERGYEQLIQEVSQESPRIVLDATDLVHISSIGFGLLLANAAELRRRGGDVRFAGLSPSLRRALTLAFGEYFQLFETPAEAARSFGAAVAG
jgi:anti-sigma B factor antagonist